uniref:Putative secreted peptide n=1 Tax=Anopheles braziliensis TaxID=58242 RepID=A0A2M3ZXR6_9DIPT
MQFPGPFASVALVIINLIAPSPTTSDRRNTFSEGYQCAAWAVGFRLPPSATISRVVVVIVAFCISNTQTGWLAAG